MNIIRQMPDYCTPESPCQSGSSFCCQVSFGGCCDICGYEDYQDCTHQNCAILFPGIESILFLLIALLDGLFQAFNPKNLFDLGILAGIVVTFNLTGLRFVMGTQKTHCNSLDSSCNTRITRWRAITLIHSHHPDHLRSAGHEFKIGNKYFCTGCYGTLIGMAITMFLMASYLLFGISAEVVFLSFIVLPFFFFPIIARYLIFPNMRTPLRLLSNILLPIGCGLLFICCDYTYSNWFVNFGITLALLGVIFLRSYIGGRDRKNQVVSI